MRLSMNSLACMPWCLSSELRMYALSVKNQGLDIVPRLLFGRSEFVDVLIESGVARQVGLTAIEEKTQVLGPVAITSTYMACYIKREP